MRTPAHSVCAQIPYMKLYTEYINSFDHAQETLATALKHSDFAEHLEKLGSASFRGHIGLSSLALTPVLRIPRYVLLLQDLKKNTPEAHPDYPNICLAFEKASVMVRSPGHQPHTHMHTYIHTYSRVTHSDHTHNKSTHTFISASPHARLTCAPL